LFLVVTGLLLVSPAGAIEVQRSESIDIQQRNGAYEVSVPVSRLVASIPRGELMLQKTPGGPENACYFMLEDMAQRLIVSGWLVPSEHYPGIEEFWTNQVKTWGERGLPEPFGVSIAKIGNWEAVYYDMAVPSASNSHLRAHWVQAGTWIDLHLSITSEGTPSENRAKLKSLLKTIRIQEKQ
jgi:hypothetical protein